MKCPRRQETPGKPVSPGGSHQRSRYFDMRDAKGTKHGEALSLRFRAVQRHDQTNGVVKGRLEDKRPDFSGAERHRGARELLAHRNPTTLVLPPGGNWFARCLLPARTLHHDLAKISAH